MQEVFGCGVSADGSFECSEILARNCGVNESMKYCSFLVQLWIRKPYSDLEQAYHAGSV